MQISFEFTNVQEYVQLMSGHRVTSKNSCPATSPFALPHVLTNNYFHEYRTEFSLCVFKTRNLKL